MRDSVQRSNQDWLLLVGLFCFFFSGAAGLIYQVVWTRMLTQIFGNTTYAIATVLSAFVVNLEDAHPSCLSRRRQMRTAATLSIEIADLHDANVTVVLTGR